MGNPASENTGSSHTWRCTFCIRFSSADLFRKPDCGTFCTWYFFRGKTDCCTYDDLSSWKIYGCHIRSHDHCGIYRFFDFHGICSSDLKESKADVHAGGKWYYDWIYLFGCDRFCSHFCRRFQHRKPSQLVTWKFFRYKLG